MNPISGLLFFVFVGAGALTLGLGTGLGALRLPLGGLLVVLGGLAPMALLMIDQWERAIILRLGRFQGAKGPGLFWIIPFVDRVTVRIDQRIQTIAFGAEKALTKDTVPVDVDAVIFWQVHDPVRAALEIMDYHLAIGQVAQTSLRESIGATPLSSLLSERRKVDEKLREEIGRKTAEWGVSVISVEIRDVAIPLSLQDAMSRQAQAEREREARVILAAAEKQVAQQFLEAADTYARNPAAMQLRAMNIIYETTKERGATILIPSAMVDAMNPGGVLGLANFGERSQTPPVGAGPWSGKPTG
ncbi:MAG: slipin family protein [Rhodospirillales bacterium]|nr:slipin family protein [Rhodospirillales bacterium]